MTGADHNRRFGDCFDWTPERCAKLAELWQEGWSGGEIAEFFKNAVTRSAVIGKVHRLRLPKRGDEERRLKSRNRARNAVNRQPMTAAQRYGLGQTSHISPLAAKKLAPLPMPPPEAATASAVKFDDLTDRSCRYVLNAEGEKLFCGCNAIPGKAWCETHFRKVYRPIDEIPIRRREIPVRQKDFYELSKEDA